MIYLSTMSVWTYSDLKNIQITTYSLGKIHFDILRSEKVNLDSGLTYSDKDYKSGDYSYTWYNTTIQVFRSTGQQFLDHLKNSVYSSEEIAKFQQWKPLCDSIRNLRCFVSVTTTSGDKQILGVRVIHCPLDEVSLLLLDNSPTLREAGYYISQDYNIRPPRWLRKKNKKKVKAE